MQRKFLFQYDDPEIAEWFDNQPHGSKAKALEQALNIIIANYGTGNFLKTVAKREVLNNDGLENSTLSDTRQTVERQNNGNSNTVNSDSTNETSPTPTESKADISSDELRKGKGLDMLSDI